MPALFELAQLFDQVCILCHNSSCASHLEEARGAWNSWPSCIRSRFHVIDSDQLNHHFKWERKNHHFNVGQAFAYLARTYLHASSNSILVLEADYWELSIDGSLGRNDERHLPFRSPTVPSNNVGGKDCNGGIDINGVKLSDVRAVLDDVEWQVARIGYDMMEEWDKGSGVKQRQWMKQSPQGEVDCREECRCKSTRLPWLCSVTRNQAGGSLGPACEILACSAIAFHKRARSALIAYGLEQREGIASIQAIDRWINHAFETIHYVVPGRVVQNHSHMYRQMVHGRNRLQVTLPSSRAENMRHFAHHCAAYSHVLVRARGQ